MPGMPAAPGHVLLGRSSGHPGASHGQDVSTMVVTTSTTEGWRGVEEKPKRHGGSTGASVPRSAPRQLPLMAVAARTDVAPYHSRRSRPGVPRRRGPPAARGPGLAPRRPRRRHHPGALRPHRRAPAQAGRHRGQARHLGRAGPSARAGGPAEAAPHRRPGPRDRHRRLSATTRGPLRDHSGRASSSRSAVRSMVVTTSVTHGRRGVEEKPNRHGGSTSRSAPRS